MDFEVGAWYVRQCHSPFLRSTIVTNAFSSDLETNKSQTFAMVAPQRVAKLSTSPEVTISSPPVSYPFISDQCLKGDR